MASLWLQNVADSYFTNQRLDFLNDTISRLTPEVKLLDPRRIDFEPLQKEISKLNNRAFGLKRKVEFQEEDGDDLKSHAEQNLKDTNNLEQDVSREISLLNTAIAEVQSLATNTELGSGPKVDNALKEAQEILGKIKQVSFTDERDKATDQANQANILVSEMATYEEPVKKLVKDTDFVSDKVRDLTNQIDDMYNLTLQADERVNAAERLNFENRKLIDQDGLNNLPNVTDQVKDDVAKGEELNKKSNALIDEAEYNFINLSESYWPSFSTA